MKTKPSTNRRSDELETQLRETNQRIASLQPRVDAAAAERKIVEAKYLEKTASEQDLLAVTNAATFLECTLNSLHGIRDRLAGDIEAQLKIEANNQVIREMKSVVGKRKTTRAELSEFQAALSDVVTDMLSCKSEYDQTQEQFFNLLAKLTPGINRDMRWPVVPKAMKQEIDRVMEALEREGVTHEDVDLTLGSPELPPVQHERVIGFAESYYQGLLADEARRQREDKRDKIAAQQEQQRKITMEKLHEENKLKAVTQQRGWRFSH
jgi:hypothetical protein